MILFSAFVGQIEGMAFMGGSVITLLFIYWIQDGTVVTLKTLLWFWKSPVILKSLL